MAWSLIACCCNERRSLRPCDECETLKYLIVKFLCAEARANISQHPRHVEPSSAFLPI